MELIYESGRIVYVCVGLSVSIIIVIRCALYFIPFVLSAISYLVFSLLVPDYIDIIVLKRDS